MVENKATIFSALLLLVSSTLTLLLKSPIENAGEHAGYSILGGWVGYSLLKISAGYSTSKKCLSH